MTTPTLPARPLLPPRPASTPPGTALPTPLGLTLPRPEERWAGDGELRGTAAVVVTYNRKALLARCLDTLLRQSEPLARIYVIDNASTDGTADVVPDHERVTYLRLEHNLGGAYGFAYGVREALKGPYRHVWVMDDDCFAEEDAHAELMKWTGHSEALCGAVVARDGGYDVGHRRNFDPVSLVESWVPAERYALPSTPIDLFTFVGAMIHTDAVRRVGLPVDDFFFMSDDSEYALRLGAHGIGIRLIPASRIWHHGSLSGKPGRHPYNPQKHYYHIRNGLLIRRRYGTSPLWFAVRFWSFAVRGYAGLAKHRNLNWASARLTAEALRDALLDRAYIKEFGKA
ncbi:glycosyltransferase [Deinococcus budaensis]|uniref:GT2 family glycosyltransferase n=1 Tax=Deinococcus budaensis TaxID=1665626 RepID=A0A7W8GE06_9DEIO|nr:glycosyltransferase [Deinococcus budaensis]MBB5233861.1 GT2 family glycosyltransferase [Deinococcus budaensis]